MIGNYFLYLRREQDLCVGMITDIHQTGKFNGICRMQSMATHQSVGSMSEY